jgi:hypothetical protein
MRGRAVANAWYLSAISLIYLAIWYTRTSKAFYNVIGSLDSVQYIGLGLYYAIPDFWNQNYKVSRLPWVLLEFIARQSFSPETAAFVLQFVGSAAMSVAAWFFFRQLLSHSSALLLAIFCIFLPLAHDLVGADYHNTICGALFFAMMALLSAAIIEGSLLLAAVAGASVALALHTNPTFALMAPGIALYGLALWWHAERGPQFALRSVGLLIVGAVAATVVLGIVSAAFGRGFLFFKPQLDYVLWVRKNNFWWERPTWDAFARSKTDFFLLGVALISLFELCKSALSGRLRDRRVAAAVHAGFIFTCVLALFYQFQGQTVVLPDYMSYVLALYALLPLGWSLEQYLRPIEGRALALLSLLFAALSAFAMLESPWVYARLDLGFDRFNAGSVLPAVVALAAVAVSFAAFILASRARSNLIIIAALAMLNVFLIPDLTQYIPDSCHTSRALSRFMNDGSLIATGIAGHPRKVRVFGDPEEQMEARCFERLRPTDVASSFAEIAHDFLGKPFGQQQLDQLTRDDFDAVVKDNGIAALVTIKPETRARFVDRARMVGIGLDLASSLPEPRAGVGFYFFRARPL